jgi:hypothetical protein
LSVARKVPLPRVRVASALEQVETLPQALDKLLGGKEFPFARREL